MPKVIQMASATLAEWPGSHGPVDIFRILTDTGEVWESCTGRNYGDGSWQRVKLPWEVQPEVPFAECQNPDCPIGCPDSHCLDFPMEEVSRGCVGDRRLIDVDVLKQGAALLEKKDGASVQDEWANRMEWQRWANRNATAIMEALTAYAALEEILDHTHITELIWWTDPGVWGLRTDTDQTGEEEGNWTDPTLTGVLRAAAADFAAADELEDAEVDRG